MLEILLSLISGAACSAVATYFLKRYVAQIDKDLVQASEDLKDHSQKMSHNQLAFHNYKLEIQKTISDTRDEFRKIEKSFNEKTTQILLDMRETKVELKQLLDDSKERKTGDKEVNGKVIMILNKIPLIEEQYREVLHLLRGARPR